MHKLLSELRKHLSQIQMHKLIVILESGSLLDLCAEVNRLYKWSDFGRTDVAELQKKTGPILEAIVREYVNLDNKLPVSVKRQRYTKVIH